MKEIKGVKLITKIIVSVLICYLISWLGFETSCSNLLYKDYTDTYNELVKKQDTLNKLWEKHIEVVNKGGNKMATYGFCENKGKHEVYTKEDFATVTTIHKYVDGDYVDDEGYSIASVKTSYPGGFNRENTRIISSKIKATNESGISYFYSNEYDNPNQTASPVQIFMIMLNENDIEVVYQRGDITGTATFEIECLLMKI